MQADQTDVSTFDDEENTEAGITGEAHPDDDLAEDTVIEPNALPPGFVPET